MMKNKKLQNLFRKRGMSITRLSKEICAGRSHLSQVLNGGRSGSQTKRKIIERGLLTDEELDALGWCST